MPGIKSFGLPECKVILNRQEIEKKHMRES